MSILEKFFTFGFVSTFSVALIATWWRYIPSIIATYRKIMSKYGQVELTVNS
ncbi:MULTISPECIES: hypothetical protein [Chroococcidiopsis]|jgi:hypothetical protein|uniref:hypothetical protein n=1 Tax=Chroococcidiopsis TaxID=54298 RepID=UPI0013154734|nr:MULTISPECIES: hypothetical protein [Chroococcidiopsis]URD50876.1 hypothetical protein M5J74_02550 [Chroococcidiopsis sp. CCNUC1]